MALSRRQSLKALAAASLLPAASVKAAEKTRPIRLVVFDVGGTLIEDHGEVPNAMHDAFVHQGLEVTFDEIGTWRGASKRGMVRHFVELRAKPGTDREKLAGAIYADFSDAVDKAYRGVKAIPGAVDAVKSLQARGLLVATSTGFDRQQCDMIFGRLNWRGLFTASITSDEVVDGRPSPFMLFHAMEAAHVDGVDEVVAVGDTPLDLQAATNAGLRGVIGVTTGAATEERLRKERHTHILPSVAAVPALLKAEF